MSEFAIPLKIDDSNNTYVRVIDRNGRHVATCIGKSDAAALVRAANMLPTIARLLKDVEGNLRIESKTAAEANHNNKRDADVIARLIRELESGGGA